MCFRPHHLGVRYSLYGSTKRVVNRLEVTVMGNSGVDLAGLVDENGQSVDPTCPYPTSVVASVPVVFEPGQSNGM